jgi:hypothetical protein
VLFKTYANLLQYKAHGRAMIDEATFTKINPDYTKNQKHNYHDDEDEYYDPEAINSTITNKLHDIADDQLYSCYNTIKGFSFACQTWGEFVVEYISPVVFDDQLFSRLVLAEERKTLISSLVQH